MTEKKDKQEIKREPINQKEKKKVQGWISPLLHQKVGLYSRLLKMDMQDFLATALENYCNELDKKYGNRDIVSLLEK